MPQLNRAMFPDFYLVGAPKCGTSALYEFLRQHPQIFLPESKELLLFATDLSYRTRLAPEEFRRHFAQSRLELRVGTSHTSYMQSRTAATEIRAARPDADIIVMLRNPVEMLPSWHSQLLYETIEDIQDFERALDAEVDRRQGRRIPRGASNYYVESLYYSDVAALYRQVERYFNAFGRQHVHVIIHDDLRADPAAVYRSTLEFLAVDPAFSPAFGVVNENKTVRNRILQELYFRSDARGHQAMKRLLPSRVRQWLLAMNVRPAPRPEIAPRTRRRLEEMFRDDVTHLSVLLDRDLSSWITPN